MRAATILSTPVDTTVCGIGTQKRLGVVEVGRKISSTTTARESRDLVRHEGLMQVTADAVAELFKPTIRRKLMERQL